MTQSEKVQELEADNARLRRENDALYDMLQGMKMNLTEILKPRALKGTKPEEKVDRLREVIVRATDALLDVHDLLVAVLKEPEPKP